MIYSETLQNPLFALVVADELEAIREGWEKLVLGKVYDMVFGAPGTDEKKMTAHLDTKMAAFSWVTERHFDLLFECGDSLRHGQDELLRLVVVRSPKDKILVLQAVLQIAVDAIKKQGDNAGNDNLLPVLILIIIRAKPPDFISHLNFTLRFRNKLELSKGPVEYCMTTMMSAVTFVYNMTLSSLTLKPKELDKYFKSLQPQHRGIAQIPSSSSISYSSSPSTNTNTLSAASSSSTPFGIGDTNTTTTTSLTSSAAAAVASTSTVLFRALGDGVAAIRSAAETAAGTVDGFTQGLMAAAVGSGGNGDGSGEIGDGSIAESARIVDSSDEDRSPPLPQIPPDIPPYPSFSTSTSSSSSAVAPPSPLKPQSSTTSSSITTSVISFFSSSPPVTTFFPHQSFHSSPMNAGGSDLVASQQPHAHPSQQSYQEQERQSTLSVFETELSESERGVLEDYEMQLAMALSLSVALDPPVPRPTLFPHGNSHG